MATVAAKNSWGTGKSTEKNIKDIENIFIQAEYWSPSSSFPDGDSKKVRVQLNVNREKFKLKEL